MPSATSTPTRTRSRCSRSQPRGDTHARSGISVKLSALEPRYSLLQGARVAQQLDSTHAAPWRARAARAGIGFTIDAEEADRLDLSLEILEALARDATTREWDGLGLAVQAYGRRAPRLLEWVAGLARDSGRHMSVRLVKGAYWDSEIKRAQERGLASFPVYTSKAATDASYLQCAAASCSQRATCIYPQFATHNAFTVAAVLALAPPHARYEFQRLHGMGEALYAAARAEVPELPPVRVYAPVGTHEDLLPYLVRRLLENGANSSFVHQFLNPDLPVEQVVRDPIASLKDEAVAQADGLPPAVHIREPRALYGAERANSAGRGLRRPGGAGSPGGAGARLRRRQVRRRPDHRRGRRHAMLSVPVDSPADTRIVVGLTRDATRRGDPPGAGFRCGGAAGLGCNACGRARRVPGPCGRCAGGAPRAVPGPAGARGGQDPARCGRGIARGGGLLPLLRRARPRAVCGARSELEGPTGERNTLSLHGRGVFVCISPWNFPLAIFTGQITAALVAGNSVVAKPAPATAAGGARRHEACCTTPASPPRCCSSRPPTGRRSRRWHSRIRRWPGLPSPARRPPRRPSTAPWPARDGAIVPLIAETGGVNAMVVDATALPEQVVDDAVTSAFTSAGQRCSALRVLYLQEEIADRDHRDAHRRDALHRHRRPGAAGNRCGPGDRRRRTGAPACARGAHAPRGQAAVRVRGAGGA